MEWGNLPSWETMGATRRDGDDAIGFCGGPTAAGKKKEGKTNEKKKKRRHKAQPTRLGRVRAVDLGEGSRAGAALARVLLLAGAPPPVVELLAIRLLAPSEHAHRPAGLLHHVHDAVEHLAVGEAIARVNSSGSVLVPYWEPLIHCFEDVLL